MTTAKTRTTVANANGGGEPQRARAISRTRLRLADIFAKRVRAFSAELRLKPNPIEPAPDLSTLDPGALKEALTNLASQHEELQVAEEELRAQVDELTRLADVAGTERERYRDLFARAPVGYLITDRLGIITEVNDVAGTLVGADPRLLRRKPFTVLVEAADARALRTAMLDGKSERPIEVRLRRNPGVVCELSCSVTERGKRLLWTLVDVSARNVARASAVPDRTRIEALVNERTQHLTAALRDADDVIAREQASRHQLEQADRAKDRFIAILSHDLRGPITSVLGWIHVLRRPGSTSKATRETALHAIERSTRAQLRLVEELLDVSRIAADKLQLDRVALDVALTVRRTIESMLPIAADRGVDLSINVSPGSVHAFADRRRLEQITTNLVSNALKFTPTGGRVEVDVRTEGDHAVIAVRDTGRGIAAELLPLVFDYFRQDTRDPSCGGGLGLGLYIVKQIVELHGGTVTAHSRGPGAGARFEVRLPLHDAEAAEVGSAAHLPDTDDLEGVRVLLVEDEEDTRDLLSAVLTDRGATVAAAPDASSALAMFDSFRPDVVVSDIGLPGQDGCSMMRTLRLRSADVAAVAISGFAGQVDADRAVNAGFDLHMAKPMEASDLVDAIQQAADLHRH